jgi:Ni/Co efflux regulator RcnB
MKTNKLRVCVAVCFSALLAAPAALADKPEWAGKGKSGEWHEKGKGKGHRDRDDDRRGRHGGDYFADQHRVAVHEYYEPALRSGRCPPGLAKKNNGCMPPGQAKKWRMGQTLPRDVVYYRVPQDLVVRLGPPPSGHRYVRVASDILLITVGSAMVVDAIQNLGR